MKLTQSFYERIDDVHRDAWKDVDIYKLYQPEIARGDCASIYLADVGTTGQRCVIKMYSNQWIFDNEPILHTEISASAAFAGTGITPIMLRAPLRTTNNIYLPLELCNSWSLDHYLKKGKPFPIEVAREVAKFLGGALSAIHGRRMLHREINPKHILAHVDERGALCHKLIGFQFFKDLNAGPATSFVGTVSYNAPETASGEEYTTSADIWSLGVTLYEIATGMHPSKTDANFASTRKSLNALVFPHIPDVHPALKDLIHKCLTYVPSQRLTASQVLAHPFITLAPLPPPAPERLVPAPPKSPPHHVPAPVYPPAPVHAPLPVPVHAPLPSPVPTVAPPVQAPAHSLPKLTNTQLLKMVQEDFTKYMQYVIDTTGKAGKLKAEKRTALNPYVLESKEPLSRGGFSEIYKVKHKDTHEIYALKVVKTSKMTDVKIAELLLGEVEIMVDLKASAFTIEIVDYFVLNNELNLVLEFCNGGDLDSYVRTVLRKTHAPLAAEELKVVAWNVACGLRDMHALHMMHRDIKPKNILVVKDESGKLCDIKLCDYGLSKKVNELENLEGSTILGTFDYFAPELYTMMEQMMTGEGKGAKYDERVDVWSYGVLLYFAAFGKTILESPGSKQKVMKQRIIGYPPNPGVPELFIDLIKACLIHDVARRPRFPELLKHPFYTFVTLPSRVKMAPYIPGNLIGKSPDGLTQVFACTREKTVYALKEVLSPNPDKKQLLAEVDTLVKLRNCDNIVRLHDYFLLNAKLYLVMDYYFGGDLEKYVLEKELAKQPLSPDQQAFIGYCVLTGLDEIHRHKIIHRDIHPRNILLKTDAARKTVTAAAICDFGFAKVLLDNEAAHTKLGMYQSPEITAMQPYDAKADIWSFGMLLYFVIFGQHADRIPGNTPMEIYRGALKYNDKRPNLSRDLLAIVLDCLKAKPEERHSASDLLKARVFAKFVTK